MHAALVAIIASTPAAISGQFEATTARSRAMPTARKNRPSNKPRNGSISASSWWRKVDPDNSTPARKAPIAIDRPPISISSAAPSTTISAAAVITSRARTRASRRNNGLSSQVPAATSPASAASAVSTPATRLPVASCGNGDMNTTSASSGTISRSSNSRIETIFCPRGRAMSPRSPSSCITIAVEVRTKPAAPTNAVCGRIPSSIATPVNASVQVAICSVPRPKISRRRPHRCEGRISRPITNRNMTTPSSATCRIACGSVNQPRPNGPMINPALR